MFIQQKVHGTFSMTSNRSAAELCLIHGLTVHALDPNITKQCSYVIHSATLGEFLKYHFLQFPHQGKE